MQPVILATGLQSSGSTLLSWCFLQRPDMDGTLDGDCDLIPLPPEGVVTPYLWYKTTISSFDLEEQIRLLEDEGRQVRPLLVTRDVRAVWISLMRKPYGRNGCTAEDPPLRQRFRRFLRSWEHARDAGIPLFRYEDLATDLAAPLKRLCDSLDLPWDPSMVEWPEPDPRIADPRQDLAWLEHHFDEFNRAMGYPRHRDGLELLPGRHLPTWESCRRFKWRLQQKPWRHLAVKLGLSGYRPPPH